MGAAGPAPASLPLGGRAKRYLRRHPVLCLALLTPGIPEYLSGSSSPVGLLTSPGLFGLLLVANLGLYTAGVLLIREARVRWQLGWPSVLALGVAYGIAEEGLALATLFNPHAGPVDPATSGHLLGVNWVWSSTILPFHALYSVALPILLLELALPEWKGRPLLEGRRLRWTAAAYVATVALLGIGLGLGEYWMGLPLLVGSLLAIAGLVAVARWLPPDLVRLSGGRSTWTAGRMFGLGFALFPLLLVLPGVLLERQLPLLFVLEVAPTVCAIAFALLVRHLRADDAGASLVAFASGAIVPVAGIGVLYAIAHFPLGLPLVALVDLVAALFLGKLYRRLAGTTSRVPPNPVPVAG